MIVKGDLSCLMYTFAPINISIDKTKNTRLFYIIVINNFVLLYFFIFVLLPTKRLFFPLSPQGNCEK